MRVILHFTLKRYLIQQKGVLEVGIFLTLAFRKLLSIYVKVQTATPFCTITFKQLASFFHGSIQKTSPFSTRSTDIYRSDKQSIFHKSVQISTSFFMWALRKLPNRSEYQFLRTSQFSWLVFNNSVQSANAFSISVVRHIVLFRLFRLLAHVPGSHSQLIRFISGSTDRRLILYRSIQAVRPYCRQMFKQIAGFERKLSESQSVLVASAFSTRIFRLCSPYSTWVLAQFFHFTHFTPKSSDLLDFLSIVQTGAEF